jgi:hypothetical protein
MNNKLSIEEKARRYDELQKWFWWLERRKHYVPNRTVLKTFFKGIKEYFEEYVEE